MFNEYRFSGSLPEDASTYVTREADTELYESLTAGKFCYVLNSRQSGKSSIRVRTMRRLRDAGVECAAIDLSAGGVQNVTPEQWYVDLIDHLIESFALDVDLGNWWGKNQLHSEVTRFRKFIEEVLLVDVKENIVIFIDEIDSILSLKFTTDDFFALIRAFHNQRVDNSDYNRLTFCLLGVASPSNLIQDKKRTPFNIGRGIHLKGFQLHEVEPLRKGLEGKFADSQVVMQEILNWTGGQPFLTQKLCQLMVEESKKENPGSVEEVARAKIIDNWELQDEPEHLRTIRSRILRDEERAGYLLDLYQKICSNGEIVKNDTPEQSELLLSGLVEKQQNKLRVYNHIYKEVFNLDWIESELKKLRPYSESFKAWVDSGFIDESRLLRGNALQDAEEWAKGKNLSYQDKQFLAASKEKEIQEKIAANEQKSKLERERKDKEAAEQRNKTLSEANNKAKKRIRNGTFILFLALLGAITFGYLATKQAEKALQAQENTEQANREVELAKHKFKVEKQKADYAKQQTLQEQAKTKIAQQNADKVSREIKLAKQQLFIQKKNAYDAKIQATIAQNNTIIAERNAKIAQSNADAANQKIKSLQQQVFSVEKEIKAVQELSKIAGFLHERNLVSHSDKALRQAGLSFRIRDHRLKQAYLLASASQAYQNLSQMNQAHEKIAESIEYLSTSQFKNSEQGLQIQVFVKTIQGKIFRNHQEKAIINYANAFNILKENPRSINFSSNQNILMPDDIELLHRGLINLLIKPQQHDFKKEVWNSLKKYLFSEISYFLTLQDWKSADEKTWRLMLFIADREKESDNDSLWLGTFPCNDLLDIDHLWLTSSGGSLGLSVQKQIFIGQGNRLEIVKRKGDRLVLDLTKWEDSDVDRLNIFIQEVFKLGGLSYSKSEDLAKVGAVPYLWGSSENYYRDRKISRGLPTILPRVWENPLNKRDGTFYLFYRMNICKI